MLAISCDRKHVTVSKHVLSISSVVVRRYHIDIEPKSSDLGRNQTKMRQSHISFAVACLLGVAAPVAAAAEDLPVAVIHAQTGVASYTGTHFVAGIQLATDQANDAGLFGNDKIKLILEDTAGDKNQAITLMSRFGQQNDVLVVMGPTTSIEALAAAPVANETQVPMMTSSLSPDVLKAGPWSFKGTQSPADFMQGISRYAIDVLKLKRCAAIYDRQSDATVSQKNVVKDFFRQHNESFVSEDGILGMDTDFTAVLTKVMAQNPDCLFISTQAPQGASIIVQAKQAGLPASVKILGTSAFASSQFLEIAGKAADGVYLVADFIPGGVNDEGRQFVTAFTKKFGREPDNWDAVGYSMMRMVVNAIKDAGPSPTREKVRLGLMKIKDQDSVLGVGKITIDANRLVHYGDAVFTTEKGRFVAAK
jgi:branched-chain amino acid transport system substrate-binding protein